MNWYTKDDGSLCLGTKSSQFTKFNVVTEVKLATKINTMLNESHIALIGSFPEDWLSDKYISQKINNAAKHYFGLSKNLNASAVV